MTPFILDDIRKRITELGFGEADAVGDLCFIAYREMMDRWNANPRWTTIHYIRKEFVTMPLQSEFLRKVAYDLGAKYSKDGILAKFDEADIVTAAALAFDVFMHFHGIEYEKKKREENGDIL